MSYTTMQRFELIHQRCTPLQMRTHDEAYVSRDQIPLKRQLKMSSSYASSP